MVFRYPRVIAGFSATLLYASNEKPSGFKSTPICAISKFPSLKEAQITYHIGYSITIESNIIKTVLKISNIRCPTNIFTFTQNLNLSAISELFCIVSIQSIRSYLHSTVKTHLIHCFNIFIEVFNRLYTCDKLNNHLASIFCYFIDNLRIFCTFL